MSRTHIPTLLCGQSPDRQQAVIATIAPELEVLESTSTLESFKDAIARYFSTSTSTKSPEVIIVGGAFSNTDLEQLWIEYPSIDPSDDRSKVKWLRPAHLAPNAARVEGGGPPTPEVLAARVRKAVLLAIAHDSNGQKVWYF